MNAPPTSVAIRRYALPDWGRMDTVWRRSQPFALWKVGEQSLLYHWLDAAVDAGVEKVVLFVADRPAEVRRIMRGATLWPLQWEVRAVSDPTAEGVDDTVDRLPGMEPVETPAAGWGLIRHWHALEQSWLARFAAETAGYSIDLGVGRGCEIHPDAHLAPPYWIGDHVRVGAGCAIGPGAVIGDGALVATGARVERAHVGEGTYLGPETDLIDAVLTGATLLNLKRKARVDHLEAFIAGHAGKPRNDKRPTGAERWLAFRLWWHWRRIPRGVGQTSIRGVDGRSWPVGAGGDFVSRRRPLLREVWRGRMRLFGPLPRAEEELAGISEEWASIIRGTPPGALGYADVLGAVPGTPEEALHTVYMVTDSSGRALASCRRWARNLLVSDPKTMEKAIP